MEKVSIFIKEFTAVILTDEPSYLVNNQDAGVRSNAR